MNIPNQAKSGLEWATHRQTVLNTRNMRRLVQALNYLDPERLILIPRRQRVQHELCFYIHDAMVNLLREAESHGVSVVQYTFKDKREAEAFEKRNDPIGFFLESGRRDVAMQITLNQVNLALFSDLLHFVHEALRALEKRKFVVAFALLRKPLSQWSISGNHTRRT